LRRKLRDALHQLGGELQDAALVDTVPAALSHVRAIATA
jgi:hypothetical protein